MKWRAMPAHIADQPFMPVYLAAKQGKIVPQHTLQITHFFDLAAVRVPIPIKTSPLIVTKALLDRVCAGFEDVRERPGDFRCPVECGNPLAPCGAKYQRVSTMVRHISQTHTRFWGHLPSTSRSASATGALCFKHSLLHALVGVRLPSRPRISSTG